MIILMILNDLELVLGALMLIMKIKKVIDQTTQTRKCSLIIQSCILLYSLNNNSLIAEEAIIFNQIMIKKYFHDHENNSTSESIQCRIMKYKDHFHLNLNIEVT